MDQDNTKGQDKRNWRERLGIGAQAQAGQTPGQAPGQRDLPKMSSDFRKDAPPPAARPVASSARPPVSRATPTAPRPAATAPVRPAPMAPRANPKAPPPVSPDKLAERLRSQRDASTKMAEQRVQVAKQRSEAVAAAPPPIPVNPPASAPKPKFAFAEENEAKSAAAPITAPTPPRPAMPPQGFTPVNAQPQLSPARPPLGGGGQPGFQPRPQPAPFQPQAPQGYPGAASVPPGFPPAYGQQPVPPYRPIDPATGYAPPPGYVQPNRGFSVPPPPQGGYVPPNGPRLNMPARPTPGLNTNYQPAQSDYGQGSGSVPGAFTPTRNNRPPLRGPVPAPDAEYEDDGYGEAPIPRGASRPSSNDYQQAYREAEYGYEDEAPRSRAPWILAAMFITAIVLAGGLAWAYTKYKPFSNGQTTTQQVPAVTPPEAPAKVQAEQPVAPQSNNAATPSKKQIYDRIVGDQEVIGGDVSAPLEAPAAVPEPTPPPAETAPQPSGGDDAAPLPIPPPPGGAGGQQGSLAPASEKQSAESITPAAGESQAAVAAQDTPEIAPPSPVADTLIAESTPPAPGEIEKAANATRSLTPPVADAGTEQITDVTEPPVAPVQKKIEKKKAPASKDKLASGNLGAKPVVLVPPSKPTKAKSRQIAAEPEIASSPVDDTGGLFGDGSADPAQAPTVPVAAPKKKRTLADLFSKTPETAIQDQPVDVATAEPIVPAQQQATRKPAAPAQAAEQQASTGGDFVVQLASFRSKAEATTEFARLKARNSGTLGRFSPIISEADVGGSTRFRLSVGRMDSKSEADAVCSSLFASGERDCLVKRR
jgi:SPOR domain